MMHSFANATHRTARGFSGVLILLVLIGVAIVLVLAFGNLGGGKSYTQTVVDSKKDAEVVSLGIKGQQLAILIADYRMNNSGKAPASFEDMGADASSFLDPWGRVLRFRFDGSARDAREFVVISDGPDGTPGTADDIEQRVGLPF